MSESHRATAASWLASGEPAIVVEVVAALGSAPREAGTRMLVGLERLVGTVGGGHLEFKAIDVARAMLRNGAQSPRSVHYPLGPALGQCCGGAVTLAFTPLDDRTMEAWPKEVPRFHLQLYGAGHVGRAIVKALSPLNVLVDWIDERDSEFPQDLELPSHVNKVCVDAVEAEVDAAPRGCFYLVLTHQHDLDMRIGEAILRRNDFGFFGLIGSKTKRNRFIHRFEERGLPPAAIAGMTCPIGVSGIKGKEPEVIAVAVVAQLLQADSARRAIPSLPQAHDRELM